MKDVTGTHPLPASEGSVTGEAERGMVSEETSGPVGSLPSETPRPASSTLPHVSLSQLLSYEQCPAKYRLARIDKVPQTPQGALIGGKAIHATIERAEQEKWWDGSDDAAIEEGIRLMHKCFSVLFDAAVEEAGGADAVRWGGREVILRDESGKPYPLRDESGEIVKDARGKPLPHKAKENPSWWHLASKSMLKRYGALRRADTAAGYELLDDAAEIQVRAMLDEDHLVLGYLDAVMMVDPDGTVLPRDYKTSARSSPDQAWTYAWLLREARRLVVKQFQFVNLRATSSDKLLRYYDVETGIELVAERYRNLLRGIELAYFPEHPSSFCVSCGVLAHCEVGTAYVGAAVDGGGE